MSEEGDTDEELAGRSGLSVRGRSARGPSIGYGLFYYGDQPGNGTTTVDFLGISENSPTHPDRALYGPPTKRVGNRLEFSPQDFSSESSGSIAGSTVGILTMTICAPVGYSIDKVMGTTTLEVTIPELVTMSVAGVGGLFLLLRRRQTFF